jgi:hypothetical protein
MIANACRRVCQMEHPLPCQMQAESIFFGPFMQLDFESGLRGCLCLESDSLVGS